jgi:hypothetical protein
MNYIYAVKISLGYKVETDHSEIGLYTIGNKSYFMWSEAPLYNTVDTWCSDMIYNIGSLSRDADFSVGGGSTSAAGFSVSVFNHQQFCHMLDEMGISLTGKVCEILEFVGTDEDSDSEEVYTQYTGIIDNVTGWDESTLNFSVVPQQFKRQSNMGKFYNDVDIIPISFGHSDPEGKRYFIAKRTLTVEKILTLQDMNQGGEVYPPNYNLFPVERRIFEAGEENEPTLIYRIQLGMMDEDAFKDASFFEGKYILIKEGNSSGTYRKIHNCEKIQHGTNAIVQIEIMDYLPEADMIGNITGDIPDQGWIQFLDIQREYELDYMPCGGFVDKNGIGLSSGVNLYQLNDKDVQQIPEYGIDINQDNKYKNSLVIDPKLFLENPDTISSFYFLPVESIQRTPSAAAWFTPNNWVKLADGVYHNDNITASSPVVAETGSIADMSDKNLNTFYELNTQYTINTNNIESYALTANMFTIKLPKIENLNFTSAYLGIAVRDECNVPLLPLVAKRGYIDRRVNILDTATTVVSNANSGTDFTIDNTPDFYAHRSNNKNNIQFYGDKYEVAGSIYALYGYKLLDMQVSNVSQYEGIEEILLCMRRIWDIYSEANVTEVYTHTTRIHELFIMFESTASIKEEVYL